MISITTKSPYAVRALVALHRQGDAVPVPIAELARRGDIPVQFLEQLFAVLRRAGLLKSQRGVKGGYSFAKDPSEITVLDIVELLDGPLGGGAEGIFAEAAETREVAPVSEPESWAMIRSTGPPGANCTTTNETSMMPNSVGIMKSTRRMR